MLEHEEKKEILDAIQLIVSTEVQGISSEVKNLSSRMDGFILGQNETNRIIQGSIDKLQGTVGELQNKVDGMEGSIKSLEEGQQETHEMIQAFATHVDERFEQVDRRFEQVDKRFEQIDQRFEQVDKRFERIEGKVGQMGSSMITKDYLDDKLAEHGAQYGGQIRKTNLKIEVLTDSLVAEKSLSAETAKRVTSAEPFGRMK